MVYEVWGSNTIVARDVTQRIIYTSILALVLTICILIPSPIPADFEYRADYPTGNGPHAARLADLDDDDDLDIVTSDYYADKVSVLLNDGEGIFSKESEYVTGDGPRSFFLADVDNDFDEDIVTANYIDDTVSVLKNHGNGAFAPKVDYDAGAGPFYIFLADVGEDANNDLDIITADDQDDRVSVLENDGSGAFSNRNSYQVGSRPKGVFCADLNDDGKSDIACANWADYTVSILFNKGDGTFKSEINYDTGRGPRSIFLADVNGDEYPDLVTANQYDNTTSILINNGDETFKSKVDYTVGTNPLSILLSDIDYDNDNDILTTNLHDNTISVLKNDGQGNFQSRIDYSTDRGPYSVVLGDVNGDDEVDLVTANNYADTVSVRYSHFPSSIMVTQPDGANDITDTSYMITWEDCYPYGEATITLYWDDNGNGLDGTEIAGSLSEDDDGIGGRYYWNISNMPEGDYWIYAKIDDGVYEPSYDYSPGPLTIDYSQSSNSPPTFQIIEPDGNGDFADIEFTIMWMDSDPDDDAAISLYYDTDNIGFDGTLIVQGLGEDADGTSGFYTWNTTNMTESRYYVYGICNDGVNDPVMHYSSFSLLINHTSFENDPPSMEFLEPDGVDDNAHLEFLIAWTDSDSDDDAQISLYYDTDSVGYDGVLIASGISENADGGLGYYSWDTTDIPEGRYFILGICNDGINDQVEQYSLHQVIVNHTPKNDPPDIEILEPDGVDDNAHIEYLITWVDSDSNDDAKISLFYDTDSSGKDGVLIASDLSEDEQGGTGGYFWDTTSISEGEYWIYAKIEDGSFEVKYNYSLGPLTVDHLATSNNPPSFQIIEPDGDMDFADFEFTIIWQDSDPDDDATISLYYDIDDDGYDGAQIVSGLGEDADGKSGIYTWITVKIPEGKYYLYGVCDDGTNDAVRHYSSFPVTIEHGPSEDNNLDPQRNYSPKILIVEPDGKNDWANTEYMITWIDADSDDDASISLYYDSDSSGYNGILIADRIGEDEYGNSGIYIWDTTSIPEGSYHVYGVIEDGTDFSRDYSQGKITINRTLTFNTAPKILILTPEKGIVFVDYNFTIKWIDSDPDDSATISLYYDTNQNGYDGTLIVSGLSEDDKGDSFLWDVKDLPEGEYYIYAVIQDQENDPVYDYSDGKVKIHHPQPEGKEKEPEEQINPNLLALMILMVLIIISLLLLILKKRREAEGDEEEEEEDFEDSEGGERKPSSEEDIDEDEIDEDLLPATEDTKKEAPRPEEDANDEIVKDLPPAPKETEKEVPQPEEIADDEIDEDLLPTPEE
ncbi:MAG: VCBS repeat-containing protein [Thermoplasmata archaeon]|nr:MAG: VCBS repeat-containing protein [Thermoplasmata archaeon]